MKAVIAIFLLVCIALLCSSQQYGVGFIDIAKQPTRLAVAGGPANLLLSNLIGYWELDEESGVRYDAHSTNDLTDNNTVLYGSGVIDNAADLEDDNGEHLSRANADADELCSFGSDDAFTIQAWINIELSPASGTGGIVGNGDSSEGYSFAIRSSGNLRLYITGQTSSTTHETTQPSTNAWHHVIVYHDPAGDEVGIIIDDGTPSTKAWSDGTSTSTKDFSIGSYSALPGYSFDGMIDEAAVWKRMLTSAEITALYNSGSGKPYSEFEE